MFFGDEKKIDIEEFMRGCEITPSGQVVKKKTQEEKDLEEATKELEDFLK